MLTDEILSRRLSCGVEVGGCILVVVVEKSLNKFSWLSFIFQNLNNVLISSHALVIIKS